MIFNDRMMFNPHRQWLQLRRLFDPQPAGALRKHRYAFDSGLYARR